MATAILETEIVEKVVTEEVVTGVTLQLSKDEAEWLLKAMGHFAGSTSYKIYHALATVPNIHGDWHGDRPKSPVTFRF